MLNDLISFLFIRSKINLSLLSMSNECYKQTTETIEVYDKQIRRYLGLGFLLSFIPQTEAFMARKAQFLNLKALEERKTLSLAEGILKSIATSPLYFITSPTYYLLDVINDTLDADDRCKFPWNPSNYLNPFGYIIKLFFLFIPFDTKNEDLPPIVSIMLLFTFISLAILYMTVDFSLNAIALFTLEPLIFVFQVFQQLITHWNDEFLFVPTAEYNNSVNKIQHALVIKINPELVNSAIQIKTEDNDYTFKTISSEEKNVFSECRNSVFFKMYKDIIFTPKYTNESIAKVYNSLKNLQQFYFFTKQNNIPTDMFSEVKDKLIQIEGTRLEDTNASTI